MDYSSCDPPKSVLWPFLAGLLAALAYMLPELVLPFSPSYDDTAQMQAAFRAFHGGSLTYDLGDPLHDLATPHLRSVIIGWPPLYPLLLLAGMKVGLPLLVVVRVCEVIAVLVGVLGWVYLARRHLNPFLLLTFAAWGILASFANRDSQTNILVWGLMPWVLLPLLDSQAFRLCSWRVVVSSLCLSLCMATRYSSIYLIPAAVSILVLLHPGALKERILRAAAYSALPVATVLVVAIINRQLNGRSNFTSELTSGFFPAALFASSAPLRALFVNDFGLGILWEKLSKVIGAGVVTALVVALRLPLTAALTAAVRNKTAYDQSARRLILGVAITFAWLVAMLGWLTLRRQVANDWTFLGHYRYYSDLAPALFIAWLVVLPPLFRRERAKRWWDPLESTCRHASLSIL